MKFNQTMKLLGVVGKKGSGTLDNGKPWETDRVELHFLGEFPSDDEMSFGSTVSVYRVNDFDLHYKKAVALVGQDVSVDLEMVSSKNLGAAPKLQIVDFNPIAQRSVKAG